MFKKLNVITAAALSFAMMFSVGAYAAQPSLQEKILQRWKRLEDIPLSSHVPTVFR